MERPRYRKSFELVAYAYEADLHCPTCASERFGEALKRRILPIDTEGNTVTPVTLEEVTDQDSCGECRRRLDE